MCLCKLNDDITLHTHSHYNIIILYIHPVADIQTGRTGGNTVARTTIVSHAAADTVITAMCLLGGIGAHRTRTHYTRRARTSV